MNNNDNVTPSEANSYPDDNPKTRFGILKTPMHLVPPSAKIALAEGFSDGAVKYGPYNWREKTVSASVYVAAAQRHMDAWWDGEEVAKDSQVHHIAHAMACLAIIYDGLTIGKLNDDRPPKGAAGTLQEAYAERKTKEKNEQQQLEPAGSTDSDDTLPGRRWRDRIERTLTRSAELVGPTDAVVHGGLSDLQADLQSGYVTQLAHGDPNESFYYTHDGGVERYDHAGNRVSSVAAEGRVHS